MATNQNLLAQIKIQKLSELSKWLSKMDPSPKKASESSYRNLVKKCETKHRKLQKDKNKSEDKAQDFENFLNSPIEFPHHSYHLKVSKDLQVPCVSHSNCSYKDTASELSHEVTCLNSENLMLKSDNLMLKKSKISQETFKKLKNEIKIQKRAIKNFQLTVNRKNAELKRLRLRLGRSEARSKKLKQTVTEKEMEKTEIQQENEQLNVSFQENEIEIKDLINERDYLHQIINDNDDTLNYYDNGKYSHELRTCMYELLTLNVSASNMGKVVNGVLRLTGKTLKPVPSRSTVLNMNVERLVMSQKQVGETLTNEPNLTLYTDETTKFGTKISGYHVSDSKGNVFVLGMREIVTKSGADTLVAFEQILGDIEERSQQTNNQSAKRILANITCTMSDRASTEKKFNSLLEELRTSVLPDLNENWDHLSNDDQVAASRILNFFCGLHGLVHFADCANKSAISVQRELQEDSGSAIFDKSFHKANESGALRLVRTACKALARGADDKNGKYQEFNLYNQEFLKENNMNSLPLTPFKGNRFNILFESSAAVFFMRDRIKSFLQDYQTNGLLKAVLYDLNIVEYFAGVKALGLISRLATGPLWSLLEDKSVHIFEMNEHYVEFIIFLYESVNDMDGFMRGQREIFNAVHKDAIYESLIQEWEHDEVVVMYLNVMLPAMAECAKRMYADHLPGGKWNDISPDMAVKANSVMKHNKFAESVFGYLDNLLRKKPNVSVLTSEACIMFKANKTNEWINMRTDEEKSILVNEAMKESHKVKANFKRRKEDIKRKQREAMAERARIEAEKEANRVQRLENITYGMIDFGLWQSEEEVDSQLSELKTKTLKIKALKVQLNFRKKVLLQNPTEGDMKSVYTFSKKVDSENENRKDRTDLSVEELTVNLKKLVRHAFTVQPVPTDGEVPPRALLVGKNVEHRFINQDQDTWWRGRVISQVPGYPKWYNIVYDDDLAVYTYQLMSDYERGDLKLIIEEI